MALPHPISVISSSCFNDLASSWSIKIEPPNTTLFMPTSAFFPCLGFCSVYGAARAPLIVAGTALSLRTAVCLGATGSMYFLLVAQKSVQSRLTIFLLGPCFRMNSLSASIVMPRRLMPRIVGNLGSSHPHTTPRSTSLVSSRLERSVRIKFMRAKSQM